MLLLTCSELLTRLFLIKGWIYKENQKDFAGGKEVLDFTEGGGFPVLGKKWKIPSQTEKVRLFPRNSLPSVPTSKYLYR